MSNDLSFLNTYTEVMHDNVTSIIKQNFVFQTQLKIAENKVAQLEDAKRTADTLSVQNRDLQTKVNELTNLTSSYKNVVDDKGRLQVSLNETSQVKNQLQSQINDMQQELTRLRTKEQELDKVKLENTNLKKQLEKMLEKPAEPETTKKILKTKITPKTAIAGTF
jgi:chromosome segregation ATPase